MLSFVFGTHWPRSNFSSEVNAMLYVNMTSQLSPLESNVPKVTWLPTLPISSFLAPAPGSCSGSVALHVRLNQASKSRNAVKVVGHHRYRILAMPCGTDAGFGIAS